MYVETPDEARKITWLDYLVIQLQQAGVRALEFLGRVALAEDIVLARERHFQDT